MIQYIDADGIFADVDMAHLREDGCVAVSETLTPVMIFNAYQRGIFPWYEDENWVYWFATHPRFVLHPEKLHISHSLKKAIRKKSYDITINQSFEEVMASCASSLRKNQEGTWISERFQVAYTTLHRMGYAHSFEYRQPESQELLGGFYGVQIGRVFYGESMFAKVADASKIAFAIAVPFLQKAGIALIDCQQETEYLKSFGAELCPLPDFIAEIRILNLQNLNIDLTSVKKIEW